MGATFFVGNSDGLHVTLNRRASDALEILLDEALREKYIDIYKKIMKMEVLDQISFTDLNKTEFMLAIQVIRDCLPNRPAPTEGLLTQRKIWEEEIEPLIKKDQRYSLD